MITPLFAVRTFRRPAAQLSAAPERSASFASTLDALRANAAERKPSAARATGPASGVEAAQRTAGPRVVAAGDLDAPAAAAPWLRSPARRALAASIQGAARHAGVDPDLSLAVAIAESSLDPHAKSSDGLSQGTFQVTRPTAADIRGRFARGTLQRPPGSDDVALGVAHLRYLHDLFERGGSLGGERRVVAIDEADERSRFAVAAYNAGEGRVASAQRRAAERGLDPTRFESIASFLPASTRTYVGRVVSYAGRTQTSRTRVA